MKGHRNKRIVAGGYAAGTLGELQSEKPAHHFAKSKGCRAGNHSWLFGAVCAVCSQCGYTVDRSGVEPKLRNSERKGDK